MTVLGTIGFVGVGEISRAMVTGLAPRTDLFDRIVLSPRGAETTAALAEAFSAVSVADSNQAVVDAADTVVLSVRPDQLDEAIAPLTFRADQVVLSALAATSLERVRGAVGAPATVVRCIPLPPAARRASVTVICPDQPVARAFFDAMGQALPVDDETALAVFSAITGAFTGSLQYLSVVCDWATAQGVPRDAAETFVRTTFSELAPALRDPARSMAQIVRDHETVGGLNEQLRHEVFDERGTAALTGALDRLHDRVTRG